MSPTATGRPYPLHLSLMINMAHLIPVVRGKTNDATHSEAEIILFDRGTGADSTNSICSLRPSDGDGLDAVQLWGRGEVIKRRIKSVARLPEPAMSPCKTSHLNNCHFLLIPPADNLINYVNSE